MIDYSQPKENFYGLSLPRPEQVGTVSAAKIFNVTSEHIRRLVESEELAGINISPPCKKIEWRITRSSLKDFIKRRTSGPLSIIDFSFMDVPGNLDIPEAPLLSVIQVADFLKTSDQHIRNLIDAEELLSINVALSGRRRDPRIQRVGLIHFIHERMEGAY